MIFYIPRARPRDFVARRLSSSLEISKSRFKKRSTCGKSNDCLGTQKSNRLCTKTVYGGAHEDFFKVEIAGHGTPHLTSQNKTKQQILQSRS